MQLLHLLLLPFIFSLGKCITLHNNAVVKYIRDCLKILRFSKFCRRGTLRNRITILSFHRLARVRAGTGTWVSSYDSSSPKSFKILHKFKIKLCM